MSAETLERGSTASRPAQSNWIAWAILIPVLATTAIMLWWQADVARILEDTLQHIGVARNLLRGDGLQTTLLFYDAQYAPGTLPAPQTVWPPGIPLGIAALTFTGVEAGTAALLLAWLSFVTTAVLIAWILTRAAVGPVIAGLASAVWAASATNWMSAAIAASELPFAALLLAATVALVTALGRERGHIPLLALAGVAAGCAVGVRYMGVFFVAAAGCVVLASSHATWRRRLAAVVAFSVAPTIVIVSLISRNFLATGQLSGGQFGVTQEVGPLGAVRRAWWSTTELLALPGDGALATATQVAFLGLVGLATLSIVRFAPWRRGAVPDSQRTFQCRLLAVGFAYCGATALLHLAWAMTIHEGMLDSRYFEPLLPFACIVFAIAANASYERSRIRQRLAVGFGVALCAGYALLQWQSWSGTWSGYASVANDRAVARALATPFAGTTAGRWLASADDIGPIVATLEHALHVQLDHPVLGLPDSRYTTQQWDEHAVLELMRRYRSCVVFFVPQRFTPNPERAANLTFLRSLAAGQPPSWLEPLLRSPDVELYGRVDDGGCSASISQGSTPRITAPGRSE
jgi:hypothetical protein